MKVVITDTGIYPGKLTEGDLLLSNRLNIHECTMCRECWIKTPGICVHDDDLKYFGYVLSECDEVIIVSRCLYGSFSAFVQKTVERMMPFLLPEYQYKDNHVTNKIRYRNRFSLSVYFYGENAAEMQTEARKTVRLCAESLQARTHKTFFSHSALQIGDQQV